MGKSVKQIAVVNPGLCVCCNLCIRACSFETANIVYLDEEDKKLKVKTDPGCCTGCGACVPVCRVGARTIETSEGEQGTPRIFEPDLGDITAAFEEMGLKNEELRRIDCGACGSKTCLAMARKIALKVNLPVNCIVKARADVIKEHSRNLELYRKNAEYIELVHEVGAILLSINDENFSEAMVNALDALRTTLASCGVHLWKTEEGEYGTRLRRIYGYPVREETGHDEFDERLLPGWTAELSAGRSIGRNFSIMSDQEKNLFQPAGIASVLAVPMFIKNKFWGLITVNSVYERSFTEDDLAVITAGGLLIVSSLLEQEMTESLIEAREAALAGTRAKSDFLSQMSHEIRTPMNAIIGMTKIAEKTEDLGKLRYCLSTINGSSTHLLGLINDILDMSKIEAGKFDLDSVPFNLENALVNICALISEKTEHKNQTLCVLSSPDMHVYYQGDELRFSQVITNLLSNAVKFTPEGGKITIRVEESAETAKSALGTDEGVSRLLFSVSDTGIGMNTEQKEKIFSPFQQADRNITRRFGGTGLGLAISKSIVEKMNGRIWVESEAGKGSSFMFEIDLLRTEAPEAVPARSIYPRDMRVLVVENDPELRNQLAGGIEKFGMKAESALSGAEAAAMAAQKAYDAAFIEYRLSRDGGPVPGTAGLDAARILADVFDPARIVMICSFLEWNKIEETAAKAGICHFISKPVFPSSLFDSINTVAGKSLLEAAKPDSPQAAEAPDFSGLNLLLADDIEINREIFLAILEETRIRIDTAEDGKLAVQKFREDPEKYDLIVMDVQMPEMDGLEATRTIREIETELRKQNGAAPEIPIIAMTANVFKEDIEKCLEAGMNDHLKKPIEETTLLEKIALYTKAGKKARAG
jgi:signal transduction histidine kinase/DNA-binding response OmpR family regulator/ferredoxin